MKFFSKMDMPVMLIEAIRRVREDIGKVAVMRGPVVYCLEEIDNQDQLQVNLSGRKPSVHRNL